MFFIIIRGPAGVGKSTVAKELSKILKARYITFDKVMSKHKLDTIKGEGISAENFVKANNMVLNKALGSLKKNDIVVFDGCFYRKEQIEHLLKNIPYKSYIFSLKAPINTCINRNRTRKKDMTNVAIHDVHNLVSKYECGIVIKTKNKTKEQVVQEILSYLKIKNC